MSQRVEDALAWALAAMILAAVIGGLIWASAHIPCHWYQFSAASDVPARCLTNFKH
ncbi:hypothetical protein OG474_29940 [Kribbella sp. NBC_01505]|uniref:hypothetical protein n=1 Tax=Kribbella sp. NBC_01505 TaxID=2903580 RepID=UPI003865EDC9